MKNLLALFLVLAFIGCSSDDTVTISKDEYNKLTKDSIIDIYPKPFKINLNWIRFNKDDGIVMASDGHEYLVISGSTYSRNVEHYIECVKCSKRWKKIDSLLNL